MDAGLTIVIFAISWWLIFFITLPIGIHRDENPEPGMDPGAPVRPRLLLKAAVTTLATALLTAALYVAADLGWLPIRDWIAPGA